MKGVYHSNSEEIKPYITVAMTLLNILDSLKGKRCEWLLGYPQPRFYCPSGNCDHFGLYGLTNLDDQVLFFFIYYFYQFKLMIFNNW